MDTELLKKLLEQAQVKVENSENPNPITSYDLFELGFSGAPNAKQNKRNLLKALDLPEFLSTSSLLSYINSSMTRENFLNIVENL